MGYWTRNSTIAVYYRINAVFMPIYCTMCFTVHCILHQALVNCIIFVMYSTKGLYIALISRVVYKVLLPCIDLVIYSAKRLSIAFIPHVHYKLWVAVCVRFLSRKPDIRTKVKSNIRRKNEQFSNTPVHKSEFHWTIIRTDMNNFYFLLQSVFEICNYGVAVV